jgi:hypothetical protein
MEAEATKGAPVLLFVSMGNTAALAARSNQLKTGREEVFILADNLFVVCSVTGELTLRGQ